MSCDPISDLINWVSLKIFVMRRKIYRNSRFDLVTQNTRQHLTILIANSSLKSILLIKIWQENVEFSIKWCNFYWPSDVVFERWVVARICKFLRKSKEKRPEKGPLSMNKSYCVFSQSDRVNCIRWPDDDERAPYMGRWVFETPNTKPHCVSLIWCVLSKNFHCETSPSILVEYYTIMALMYHLDC